MRSPHDCGEIRHIFKGQLHIAQNNVEAPNEGKEAPQQYAEVFVGEGRARGFQKVERCPTIIKGRPAMPLIYKTTPLDFRGGVELATQIKSHF